MIHLRTFKGNNALAAHICSLRWNRPEAGDRRKVAFVRSGGEMGPLSQAPARSVGCPAPGPARVATRCGGYGSLTHIDSQLKKKKCMVIFTKNLTPEQEISHPNKQNERSNDGFTPSITGVVFCRHRRQVSPHPAMPRDRITWHRYNYAYLHFLLKLPKYNFISHQMFENTLLFY